MFSSPLSPRKEPKAGIKMPTFYIEQARSKIKAMGKGRSGKVQGTVFRAVCLSQDQDDNPKGGFLD